MGAEAGCVQGLGQHSSNTGLVRRSVRATGGLGPRGGLGKGEESLRGAVRPGCRGVPCLIIASSLFLLK